MWNFNWELRLRNSLSLATHSELGTYSEMGTFIRDSELRPQNGELIIWNLECGTPLELGTQSEW